MPDREDSEGARAGGAGAAGAELSPEVLARQRLAEQLLQSKKMEAVARLASGIAHEFNNMLAVIRGIGEIVLSELPEDDPLRADMTEIARAAERATALTRRLLAISGKQTLNPKVLSLNALVTAMDELLRRAIGEHIVLATKLEQGLELVKADPGQMEQVVMNLVVNARDAMRDGGKITLETGNVELDESYTRPPVDVPPGRYVMLAVSDTGRGMDPAVRERVFDPFFTTKEKGKEAGLGLSTVYGIIKQSDGHISVRSEVGQGTTFNIYLPATTEPARGVS